MAEAPWRPQGPAIPQGVSRQGSDRRVEPPLVVQNAMLTKDKKPFTYTPGGIDLSEISSPRLARRVERNAMAPGVAEVQRTSPPRGYTGPPLPPSALAAMQPALPVQVFPSGPPPPPPIPAGGPAPPPPPPPMDALPTKSFATNEGVFERPDMTKIIPENPMALLKKTPRVQRPVSDGIQYGGVQEYSQQPPIQMNQQGQPPKMGQMNQSPPILQMNQAVQPPPLVQMVQQRQMEPPQPEIKTSTAQLGTLYIPPVENQNQKRIATPPVIERTIQTPPTPQRTVPQSPGSPQSPIATLTKAPRPWQNQKPPSQEAPAWVQRSQTPPESPQRSSPVPIVTTPKTPITPNYPSQERPFPSRGNQSPGVQGNVIGRVIIPVQMDGSRPNTNTEAVYITQPVVLQHPGNRVEGDQQNVAREQQMRIQQEQQKRQQEQRMMQEQHVREQQLREQQMREQQMREQQMREQQVREQQLREQQLKEQQLRQQQLMQQRQLQQQQMQQQSNKKSENVRIIPIQIEGGNTGSNTNGNVQRQDSNKFGNSNPATPGTARVFNRQPSWSQSGPTQSNSFKVIQKLTNTDGDEDEDEDPSEHPPRNSQHFQQQPPIEQTRKMVLNDSDKELMNKVKQVVLIEKDEENPRYRGGHIPSRIFKILDASGIDQEIYLHRETDPRYRGAAIPSKAFRLLQSMTDGGNTVPKSSQSQNVGSSSNNVRMIPVQIEGGSSSNYVPPSEQTVEEPKKYTGGKIPSRSFKMLQAMTGDPCAAPHQDSQYFGYAPRFPPQCFPPYCPPYFVPPPYSPQFSMSPSPSLKSKSARTTPVHFSSNKTNKRSYYDDESEFYDKKSRSSSLPRRFPQKNSFWNDSDYEEDEERYFRERRRSPYGFWDPYYMYCYPQQVYPYHMYNYGYHDDFEDDFEEEEECRNEENQSGKNVESETESFSENSSFNVEQKNSVGYSDDEYEVSEEECEENEPKSETQTEEIPHELSVIFEESERSDFVVKDSSSETLAVDEIVEDDTKEEILKEKVVQKDFEKLDKDWWSEIKPLNDDEICLKKQEENEEVDFWKTILQEDKIKIPKPQNNHEVIIENHEKSGTIIEENDKEIFEDKFEEKSENVSMSAKDHKYKLNKSQCNETFNLKPKNEENSEENYVRSSKEQSENYEYQKDDVKCLINSEKNVDNTDFRIKEGSSIYHGNLSVSSRKKIFKESIEPPKIIKKEGISIEKEDSSSEIVKKTTVCSIIVDDEDVDKENEKEDANKEEIKIPSIKERIAALKIASEKAKEFKMVQDKVEKVNKIKNNLEEKQRKEKIKKEIEPEENSSDSEEEIDSGVTSDISRHISDTEEYSELNKMSKYQRAATHSRLFKLLQDECELEEIQENEKKDEKNQKNQENIQKRKESLTLDLKPDEEGFNSSGIDSLTPPINDKLVKELVRSLLKGKRGEAFREMPLEKLHNAAYRILQEEIFDSNDSKSSTAIQTPQDFYNDDDKFSYSTPYSTSNPNLIRYVRSKPETNTS
ncbi:trichohyalin-like isoform X1 [Onthophagus taurus]|uniref:trichohyalin-like isoform X1 n=1 Tax=Onthophagus taurus TaxID=166361 RepID=UPI0039BE24C2